MINQEPCEGSALRYAIAVGCLFGFVGMCIVAAAYILCEKFGLLRFSDSELQTTALSEEHSLPPVAERREPHLGQHVKTSLMSSTTCQRPVAKNRSSD
jgi:hypothetical protein